MSQRSRNRRPQNVVVSDDYIEEEEQEEEFTPTQSQGECQVSEKDVKKLAGQVCNMLLATELKKIPLKSSEIKKSIVSLKSRSAYKIVMNKAEEMMEHLFGYKIVSVKNNSYIMVNNMRKNIIKFEQIPRNEKVRRGLLIAILAVIFMNEEKINAAGLESFLESLDFDLATSSKTTIQEFVRQRYLETAVQDLGDASMLMYKWGDRANAEFRKKEVLECICQIYGNMKPSMWTYQWKLVNAEKNGEENSS